MKKALQTIPILLIVMQLCKAQDTTKRIYYSKDFKWKIEIPANFDTVSVVEWAKMKNKGSQAVEKTYNQKVIDQTKTLIVFKSTGYNYFEANTQLFDTKKDGSYAASCKSVDDILYTTLKTQAPNATLDSISVKTNIGGLDFNTFIMQMKIGDNVAFSIYSFSRLFGNREFSANIMFMNSGMGDVMLDAWKKSTFGQP